MLNSGNINRSELEVGKTVDLNEITLNPAEGVVVEIEREDRRKDEL